MLLGVEGALVPLFDEDVDGDVVEVAGAAGVEPAAVSFDSFVGLDDESEDSPAGGFILSE